MKVVVYTSLFGDHDSVKEPLCIDKSVDYILFTDDPSIKSEKWTIKVLENQFESPRKMARLIKLLSHKFLPEHDLSIYLDANFKLKAKDIYEMIVECLEGQDIALYKHPRRSCTYQELEHCLKVNKVSTEIADRVKIKYLNEGFPRDYGLFESGFIIRKNTEKINQLNELWWNEIATGSERDQCSLVYCLWKLGITANEIKIGQQIRINPYITGYKHKKNS